MKPERALLLSFALVTAVCAQSGRIAGPVSGFLYDATAGGVRPILGIPGAALLGQPMDLGFEPALAAVSPAQDSLLAVSADGQVHVFRLDAGAVTERASDGLAPAPERIVFSPRGSAALLYRAGSLQVVSGLPDAPAAARTLDLGAPAAPAFLAVSDDGAAVLASGGGSLRVAGESGEFLTVATGDGPAAFSPGSRDAAAADVSANLVTLYRNVDTTADPAVLAGPDDGVDNPVGLAFSADAGRLFVASAGSQSVLSLPLNGGDRLSVACGLTPTGLAPMGSLYRLNDAGSVPLWVLDAQGDSMRVAFVPPAQ